MNVESAQARYWGPYVGPADFWFGGGHPTACATALALLMKLMGEKIRRTRIRRALTLADLAALAGISKAYLSLIETGRLANPPSDEKLQRLEKVLEFPAGELVGQAHFHRTPQDVRAMLEGLIRRKGKPTIADAFWGSSAGPGTNETGESSGKEAVLGHAGALPVPPAGTLPLNLDAAFLSGVLQELAERTSGNIEALPAAQAESEPGALVSGRRPRIPIVNKVSAGYPKDFTDLSYPPRMADGFISAPGIDDPDAFAARVSGDSMSPKYAEGDIVIFSPAASWKDGADCFVRFEDGQTTFKRVYVERSTDGLEMLRLQPRNERYRPRVEPREDIAGVYRAVSVYRRVE